MADTDTGRDLMWEASNVSDAEWFRLTGHCGDCGDHPSRCDCNGQCGCAHLHGEVPA
jgi:hypothetical protein